MKTIDTSKLPPLVEIPSTEQDRMKAREYVMRPSFRMTKPSPEEIEKLVEKTLANWRASHTMLGWLKLNFPVGGVFDYMGVPVMVRRIENQTAPMTPASNKWVALCHCRGEGGGLMELRFTPMDLLALFGT